MGGASTWDDSKHKTLHRCSSATSGLSAKEELSQKKKKKKQKTPNKKQPTNLTFENYSEKKIK